LIATIDFETTGLKAGEDEVLQVSIIDENYNVLLNVYCRPNNKGSWEDAQAVHGITPLMVANELPFERYVPTVLDILSKADKVIAYNAAFEDSYLKAYGIEVDPEKLRPVDVPIIEADIRKLVECTGWKREIPLERTIEETLDYWRKEVK